MPTVRPMFNVKALKNDMGYVIEAIWPDRPNESINAKLHFAHPLS
jgi:hypothetical protein